MTWCSPLYHACYSCTLQTVASHASVGSEIYYCYGQWLFPYIVDNHAASCTDLEHMTYRVSVNLIEADTNFQISSRFSESLQMCSLPREHIKRFCKLCLTWDEDWPPLLVPCHHTTKCFCLQSKIFHYLLIFMKFLLFSQQDHNMQKFLQKFHVHLNMVFNFLWVHPWAACSAEK